MSKIGTCKHNSKVENGAEDEEVQDSIINENDLKATQKNPHFFFFLLIKYTTTKWIINTRLYNIGLYQILLVRFKFQSISKQDFKYILKWNSISK